VLPSGDVRRSRDPWCRQPLPKLKENAIKQMAVIVSLSAKSFFCCLHGSFVYRSLYFTAETTLCEKFFFPEIFIMYDHDLSGNSRDSVFGIATRYEMDGPGFETRCGLHFPEPSRPASRPTRPPVKWLPDLFHGGKAAGA
jgi:hypothetical protein